MTDLEEFAKKMEALTRLGVELIEASDDDQEQDKRETTAPPADFLGVMIPTAAALPKKPEAIKAEERGSLKIVASVRQTEEQAKRAFLLDPQAFPRLREIFEIVELDAEGKEKPAATVSKKADGEGWPSALVVRFPDGFEIEDKGHALTAHALPEMLDDSAAQRLFDYADAVEVWKRWGTPKRAKRHDWEDWGAANACGSPFWIAVTYREAFHRCRPVLPRFTVGNPAQQNEAGEWMRQLEELREQARENEGSGQGSALLGKCRVMADMFKVFNRPSPPPATLR